MKRETASLLRYSTIYTEVFNGVSGVLKVKKQHIFTITEGTFKNTQSNIQISVVSASTAEKQKALKFLYTPQMSFQNDNITKAGTSVMLPKSVNAR